MHIIVPMAGAGARFASKGHIEPKPLIRVDDKPIIEHVVNLFPGESRFTFICNRKHIDNSPIREELERVAPGCSIQSIDPHKLGPVYSVAQVFDCVDDDETIINYCDFGAWWDYRDFLDTVRNAGADGAIPAYRGFHPHMIGNPNYAFLRNQQEWMLEIREKEPFTGNRMSEFASNGTYYFRKGSLIKKYFRELLDKGIKVANEFYVSMVYNLLVRDGLKVMIYEIQHMLQWGTPEDLETYKHWSAFFRSICEQQDGTRKIFPGINLLPMAGNGRRFTEAGYTLPKPLLPVSGKPMALQAARCMPRAEQTRFACLSRHLEQYPLKKIIEASFPDAGITVLDQVSRGQAETCSIALSDVDLDCPVFIGACDNGMFWDEEDYQALLAEPDTDAVIWTFRNNPAGNLFPKQYGWVKTTDGKIARGVSVKVPISDNVASDHAVVGAFSFRSAEIFRRGLEQLTSRDIRVNGEFYIDSLAQILIELGYTVKIFEVQHYAGWGTPEDYKTYEYWQSFFHKCTWHPYSLAKDPFVDKESVAELDRRYKSFSQPYAATGGPQ